MKVSPMTQILLSLLLALSIIANPFKPTLIDSVSRSVVMIVTSSEVPGQSGVCAGFVTSASKGEAITARHCVPENEDVTLMVDGIPSEVVKQNQVFALVKIPSMSKPALDLRKDKPSLGEKVYTFGFGYGMYTIFQRYVAGLYNGDILLDGPLAHGMSGGPVVDEQGKVIGLNQASDGVTAAICGAEEIKEFLKQ